MQHKPFTRRGYSKVGILHTLLKIIKKTSHVHTNNDITSTHHCHTYTFFVMQYFLSSLSTGIIAQYKHLLKSPLFYFIFFTLTGFDPCWMLTIKWIFSDLDTDICIAYIHTQFYTHKTRNLCSHTLVPILTLKTKQKNHFSISLRLGQYDIQ